MAKERTILLIDDDVQFQSLMKEFFSEKFCLLLAKDGDTGLKIAHQSKPDLILLDLMVPVLNGLKTCRTLRDSDATSRIPVIVITAMNDFENQLNAFALGADDFLQKPFRPRELFARISSKIRRLDEAEQTKKYLNQGDVELDLDRYECRVMNEPVALTVLEFRLLRFFFDNFDKALTRDQILKNVWRDSSAGPRTIDTHLASLRKKIYNSSLEFNSLYSLGYILRFKSSTLRESKRYEESQDAKQLS